MSSSVDKVIKSKNFSAAEVNVLLCQVEENISDIRDAFGSEVTKETKAKAWSHIHNCVNAVSPCPRSIAQVSAGKLGYPNITKATCLNGLLD